MKVDGYLAAMSLVSTVIILLIGALVGKFVGERNIRDEAVIQGVAKYEFNKETKSHDFKWIRRDK